MERNIINWKVFSVLFIGCTIGIIGVIPYSLTLQADVLKEVPIPMSILIIISIVQSMVLFLIVILLGLVFSKKIGFRTPIIERLVEKKKVLQYIKSVSGISIVLGLLVGCILIIGDYLFGLIGSIDFSQIMEVPPAWQGFLVSFYGGINEEILLRLFFMSMLIWIFSKIKKTEKKEPEPVMVWVAILLSSVLFGLAHLPIVASITKITPIFIARAVILNGIGGTAYGWLYWKKGLESAIIAHFSSDLLLHVLIPFIFYL